MFQIDLNSDLKEEPDLKSSCLLLYIIWTCNAMILNKSESQYGQIYLDVRNFVNMPACAWNITCLNKPQF